MDAFSDRFGFGFKNNYGNKNASVQKHFQSINRSETRLLPCRKIIRPDPEIKWIRFQMKTRTKMFGNVNKVVIRCVSRIPCRFWADTTHRFSLSRRRDQHYSNFMCFKHGWRFSFTPTSHELFCNACKCGQYRFSYCTYLYV